MKTVLKVLGVLVLLAVLGIGGCFIYVSSAFPKVSDPEDLTIQSTPERLANGEYLVTKVAACFGCHSTTDANRYGYPVIAGTEGLGGEHYGPEIGFPGDFYADNLTPAHLGDWTDGEVLRAITAGVSKDGTPLFPMMPYHAYGTLDRRDVEDMILYLRTLPAAGEVAPESSPAFPMGMVMKLMPKDPEFTTRPDRSDPVAWGGYIANLGSCAGCHTPVDPRNHQPLLDLAFSGGQEFPMPGGGTCVAANITPSASGIGEWTEEQFLDRFRAHADSSYVPFEVEAGKPNTLMPWDIYCRMEEDDLRAIWAYLQTLPPIDNDVEFFIAPDAATASAH